MGLFDNLGSIVGDVLSGKPLDVSSIAQNVFQNAGGVDGIVSQLRQAGLGEHVDSWLGAGANKAISPEQIQQALSSEQLSSIASSLGIDPQHLPQLLAQHLPQAVSQTAQG